MAQKIGPNLTYGDLRDFTGVDVGSGLYIMNYDILPDKPSRQYQAQK